MKAHGTINAALHNNLTLTLSLGVAIVLLVAGVAKAASPGAAPDSTWVLRHWTPPQPTFDLTALQKLATSGQTIPFWTGTITSPLDKRTYALAMVGSDPGAKTKTQTTVTYVPIALRIDFGNGVVLDPADRLDCTSAGVADTISASQRFFNSPLFVPVPLKSNGQDLSAGTIPKATGVQLLNGFQRAEFWSQVRNTSYGVALQPSSVSPITVTVSAPKGSVVSSQTVRCGNAQLTTSVGQIDVYAFDSLIQQIATKYAKPNQLPIVLTRNVLGTFDGQCCIFGFHNAVQTTLGVQTYAVSAFVDSGLFKGVDDIVLWSRELAEWMDDPFLQTKVTGAGPFNMTPGWRYIGSGLGDCQTSLQVGGPLGGTVYTLPLYGFTYHAQDLVFIDWFYRTPARGTGGKYAFQSGLSFLQGVCQ